ncbi:MAG: cation:proton antiporter [Bacteroidales bacterium]|nr:cation:proton antiporter [Bacteroidales bacterium]
MGSFLIILVAYLIIVSASGTLARFFLKFKLPLITGFLIVGIISGPYITGLLDKDAVNSLSFIKDISLAFIAFAAGAELHLKEFHGRFKTISWITFGQLVIAFIISTFILYYLAEYIPFMNGMEMSGELAVSMLVATIFIASSPASAIAVINELRAKGKYTQMAIVVTVVKDVLVIILFTICFAVAATLINGDNFKINTFFELIIGLTVSVSLGFLIGKLLNFILSFFINAKFKIVFVILIGWFVFAISHFISEYSEIHWGFKFYLEPLLINIVASFYVVNYTKSRTEFLMLLEKNGMNIYVLFFTLAGASVALDVLQNYWLIALVLFIVRLFTIGLGSSIGALSAGESGLFIKTAWMPYVTQAGVALGLVTIVAGAYPLWGAEFETILIAVIVLNELFGPTIFKWSINKMGESHVKAEIPEFDGIRDALIFGLESQSLALAKTLQKHGWLVTIATLRDEINPNDYPDYHIEKIRNYSLETFEKLKASRMEAIIAMQTDVENRGICEIVYEHFGTRALIVRLNEQSNVEEFRNMGALIVEPSTSIVNLLFHFAQSPVATSILLGLEEHKETIDIEVVNPDIKGLALRDLRLPGDILILSVKRGGNTVISHGYTRLRIGDVVTVVGSQESIEKVKLKFE